MANAKENKVPFFLAQQGWINAVDSILNEMKQPMNNSVAAQTKLRNDMKNVLREAITTTQRELMLAHSGKASVVKSDSTGWTTGTTDYDKSSVKKTYPNADVVNILCKEIIKEQEEIATKAGLDVAEPQILAAQQDAVDDTKDTITLATIDTKGETATRLEINKETGDTVVYEKDLNTNEFVRVGILKRYWLNVKEFASNIWNWCANKCKQFWNWVCNIFTAPEDRKVIQAAA